MADPAPALLHVDLGQDPHVLAELIESLPHDVAILDADGAIRWTNHGWKFCGTDPLIDCGRGGNLLRHLSQLGEAERAVAEHLHDGIQRVINHRAPRFELQYEVRVEDTSRWFLLASSALADGGGVVTHTDTTVHHSVQDVLTEMAFHDALTGLPNRALVIDRVRMALVRAQRSDAFPAVMFIDLDRFKDVNDRYGHAMGDLVLIEAANRLSAAVREEDTCGRWGGDEFVLVIDLTEPASVDGLIRRTLDAFREPIVIDGVTLDIGLSIGVVVGQAADRIEHLIGRADEAMYAAKRSGHGVRVVDSRHPTMGDDGPIIRLS